MTACTMPSWRRAITLMESTLQCAAGTKTDAAAVGDMTWSSCATRTPAIVTGSPDETCTARLRCYDHGDAAPVDRVADGFAAHSMSRLRPSITDAADAHGLGRVNTMSPSTEMPSRPPAMTGIRSQPLLAAITGVMGCW